MYRRYFISVYLVTMCMDGIYISLHGYNVYGRYFISILPGYNVYVRYFISVYLVTMCMAGILYQLTWLQCV